MFVSLKRPRIMTYGAIIVCGAAGIGLVVLGLQIKRMNESLKAMDGALDCIEARQIQLSKTGFGGHGDPVTPSPAFAQLLQRCGIASTP